MCYLEYTDKYLGCFKIKTDGTAPTLVQILMANIEVNTWIHFSLGGSSSSGTYIRVDYPDQVYGFNTSVY